MSLPGLSHEPLVSLTPTLDGTLMFCKFPFFSQLKDVVRDFHSNVCKVSTSHRAAFEPFPVKCIRLIGFFNNVVISKPLQTKVRPSGKGVLFRSERKAMPALIKKMDANRCTDSF